MEKYSEYKLVMVCEGGLSTLLFGAAKVSLTKLEKVLNDAAADGWQVVYEIMEHRRFLFFWTREAVIVTLGR